MKIREYKDADCDAVSRLFFETVHSINICDYNNAQLDAWASDIESLKLNHREDLLRQNTLVAEIYGQIVGFGSIDDDGILDFLFVHRDYQRRGIATILCEELEKEYHIVKVYSSITAKRFFEKRGYKVVKEQEVVRNGVKLKNFEMQKNTDEYTGYRRF